jgi:hypothetical protein
MTGLLNDVMHERAERAGTPQLDLDTIIAAGDRRVRRGRTMTGLAAAAVAATAALTGLAVPRLLDNDSTPAPATSEFAPRHLSWAAGSTIHWGARTFDVGRRIRSYVQTDEGFVWTSPDGTVHLFDSRVDQEIGSAESGRLVTDDTGSYVAWTSPGEDGREPAYVVYDTSRREVVARVGAGQPADAGESGTVMAIDGTAVYWKHGNDIVRHDLDGESTSLWSQGAPADPGTKQDPSIWQVVDVADGDIAYFVERGDEWGLAVARRIEGDAPILSLASHGVLSPNGRYLASERDDFMAVHDTETGEDVSPDLRSYPYAVGYAWVDDDTLMAYGLTSLDGEGPYPADLMTCDISGVAGVAGGCTIVASAQIDEDSFALPGGEPLD